MYIIAIQGPFRPFCKIVIMKALYCMPAYRGSCNAEICILENCLPTPTYRLCCNFMEMQPIIFATQTPLLRKNPIKHGSELSQLY